VWLAAFLLSYFFRSTNAAIGADLREEFDLDAAQLGMMTSAFLGALAAAQLPLGAALDRWGPRRVVPLTMLSAAAGALVFAGASSLAALTLGRALLGLGFAGVLVGALHTFSSWFPPQRFASVSGLMVGAGTFGGLVAGTPLAVLVESVGWRSVFTVGAVVVAVVAAIVAALSRDAPPGGDGDDVVAARGSLADVLRDQRFWRVALMNLFAVGSLLAVQGLWAGPYLVDVHGLDTVRVGDLILLMALGVMVGNFGLSWVADRWGRQRVALAAAIAFALCSVGVVVLPAGVAVGLIGALYFAFGMFGSFGAVLFALARDAAPRHLTGRAITAVNLVGIGGAMAIQWAMGVVVEAGRDASGGYGPAAYRAAFLLVTGLGLVAIAVFVPMVRGVGRVEGRDAADHADGRHAGAGGVAVEPVVEGKEPG
jgi:MFS family permease